MRFKGLLIAELVVYSIVKLMQIRSLYKKKAIS